MKMATVRQFRDGATQFLRERQPILVTRRGELAGIYLPCPIARLPMDMKRQVFVALSEEMGRRLKKLGVTEKELQRDFRAWRGERRKVRSRR